MATLTLPHLFDAVAVLRADIARLWGKVIAGAPWARARDRSRLVGGLRALEVTHGYAGWHPHLHVLFFFDSGVDVGAFMGWLIGRWMTVAERAGYRCSRAAQDWRFADSPDAAGEYVTKAGIAWEITHLHTKKAGRGGRTPFQILADIEAHNRPQDRMLFVDYAMAFKGARQLTWFGDVKARYEVDDPTDEELAAAEREDKELVCTVSAYAFEALAAKGVADRLLEAAEDGGLLGVILFVQAHGLPSAVIRPPPVDPCPF